MELTLEAKLASVAVCIRIIFTSIFLNKFTNKRNFSRFYFITNKLFSTYLQQRKETTHALVYFSYGPVYFGDLNERVTSLLLTIAENELKEFAQLLFESSLSFFNRNNSANDIRVIHKMSVEIL